MITITTVIQFLQCWSGEQWLSSKATVPTFNSQGSEGNGQNKKHSKDYSFIPQNTTSHFLFLKILILDFIKTSVFLFLRLTMNLGFLSYLKSCNSPHIFKQN